MYILPFNTTQLYFLIIWFGIVRKRRPHWWGKGGSTKVWLNWLNGTRLYCLLFRSTKRFHSPVGKTSNTILFQIQCFKVEEKCEQWEADVVHGRPIFILNFHTSILQIYSFCAPCNANPLQIYIKDQWPLILLYIVYE